MKNVAGQGDVPMRSPTSVQAPHQVSDTAQSVLDRFFLGAQPQAGAPAAPPAPGQTSAPPPATPAPGGAPYAAPPASGAVADDWRQYLPQITPGMNREERPGGIAGTVAGLDHLMQALGRDWEPNERMKRAMRIQAGDMGPSQAQPAAPPAPAPQVTQPNYAAGGSQPINPLLAMMMGG